MIIRVAALAAILALSAGAAAAQPAVMPPNILAVPANAPPPKAVPLGPYAVTVESDPSLPTHTIYRPSDLSAFAGGKLPIVSWGNGGCANAGLAFKNFLTEIASHGFIVVAVGPIDAPLPDFRPRPGQPMTIPPSATHDSQLIDAIDWADAQNVQAGSRFQGKLDTSEVAVMGQSCGGLQAIAVAGDPRVKTAVMWNSGAFSSYNGLPQLSGATKASLARFHSPVAYFIGGPTDIAYANAEDDFKRITVPVFKGELNVGHGGTYSQPNGGWFGEVGAAWLMWRLKGDEQAGKLFEGPQCGLCVDPAWTVAKKNMN